ncbi:hypothetical protein [Enterococcus sp. AD013-P3]|uniref:hypothetical protein n=1 Tax=Enterococcus sp. AD013-P3 TaxID=3411036 RepID=UPI003B962458
MKAETEKITLNMNSMDLARIDLLVDQGYYQNRTDFLKKAIHSQIMSYHDEIAKSLSVIESKSTVLMGVVKIDSETLKNLSEGRTDVKTSITVFGICHIDKSISLEEIQQFVSEITVYGVTRANPSIKTAYGI